MIVILQLGMMVIAIGLSSYNIAIFHLVNHAFKLYRAHVKFEKLLGKLLLILIFSWGNQQGSYVEVP